MSDQSFVPDPGTEPAPVAQSTHRPACPGPGGTIYDYLELGGEWGPFETCTTSNNTGATFRQDPEHTLSAAADTTVSAELGLQVDKAVAEISARFGGPVAIHAGFHAGEHFTVDVPPHIPEFTIRTGIYLRHYAVTKFVLDGQCHKIEAATGRVNTVEARTIGTLGQQAPQGAPVAAANLTANALPPNKFNARGAAGWARANATSSDNPFGYGDDCTDFVSRAMQTGGGMPGIDVHGIFPFNHADDDNWYMVWWFGRWIGTYSWGSAPHLANFLRGTGYRREVGLNAAGPGDLIFVNWGPGGRDLPPGQHDTSGQAGIDHVGVIVGNPGPGGGYDVQIAQHTPNKIEKLSDWRRYNRNMHFWIYSIYLGA